MTDSQRIMAVVGIVILTGMAYIILTAIAPAFVSLVHDADAALVATSNMTNYPGAREVIQSSPWWMWFIPVVGGGVAIVAVLRGGK